MVMLIPLDCPGGGLDLWPATRSRICSPASRSRTSSASSLQFAAGQSHPRGHAPRSDLGRPVAPDRHDGARLPGGLAVLHPQARASRRARRASTSRSTGSCSTSGTSTSSTTCCFVRPALWLGRVLWKGGDGWLIDGFGPDGVSARVLDVTRNVVRLQTGYLYHYAFAMLIGVAALITWFMFVRGGRLMVELADPLRSRPSCRSSARCSSSCCAATTRPRTATRAGSRSGPR
mgnify:CR=1 FL=1